MFCFRRSYVWNKTLKQFQNVLEFFWSRFRVVSGSLWSPYVIGHISIFLPCDLWSPYVIGRPYIFLCCFFMVALWNRADHYIFILFLSSFFFFLLLSSSSFFSSPNLSGRRLDVYHTLAHGVALVRIQNARLKCAARGSLQIQDAKNRHLGTIAQLCQAISSQLRHVSTIGKKTC